MSETTTTKSDIHQKEEDWIKSGITNGGVDGSSFERKGRESDPRVAEAMAYASKPLIDDVLEELALPPNEGVALLQTSEGKDLGYSKAPGVVSPRGQEYSYQSMRQAVSRAHRKANDVQTGYYEKVDAAQKALDEAKADI